jgi:hypothetical protein
MTRKSFRQEMIRSGRIVGYPETGTQIFQNLVVLGAPNPVTPVLTNQSVGARE